MNNEPMKITNGTQLRRLLRDAMSRDPRLNAPKTFIIYPGFFRAGTAERETLEKAAGSVDYIITNEGDNDFDQYFAKVFGACYCGNSVVDKGAAVNGGPIYLAEPETFKAFVLRIRKQVRFIWSELERKGYFSGNFAGDKSPYWTPKGYRID